MEEVELEGFAEANKAEKEKNIEKKTLSNIWKKAAQAPAEKGLKIEGSEGGPCLRCYLWKKASTNSKKCNRATHEPRRFH